MKNPEKLLDLLAQDARLTPAQLAAMLGETEEDVAAAINAYEKNSTILGYKTVVDWDKTSKESVTALIEVKITPQKGMGFDEIARLFEGVGAIEKTHEERYRKLLANVREGLVFSRDGDRIWECGNCGHIVIGPSAPEVCPVCRHPKAYFKLKAENY